MSFWDGTKWVRGETSPRSTGSRAATWSSTMVMLVGLALLLVPLAGADARSSHRDPSCSLAAVTLGGTNVVQITAVGLPNNADFEIDWVEPLITQTEYYWSTTQGVLQDTVLNDQGSGTYSASVYWRSNHGSVWEAACSLGV